MSLAGATGAPVTGDARQQATFDPACVEDFKQLKIRHKFRWMTIRADHDTFVVSTDKTGAADSSPEDFLKVRGSRVKT
jgi:hypothetical protein